MSDDPVHLLTELAELPAKCGISGTPVRLCHDIGYVTCPSCLMAIMEEGKAASARLTELRQRKTAT